MLARCNDSEVVRVIDELMEYVRTMGVASRFRRDRYAGQGFTNDQANPPMSHLDIIHGNGRKLSEVGHKRAVLQAELQLTRTELISVFSRLAALRLDIEVTNMEPDGSHATVPTEEQLAKENVFTRSNKET